MVIIPGLTLGYITDNATTIEDGFSAFTCDYTVRFFDVGEQVPGSLGDWFSHRRYLL